MIEHPAVFPPYFSQLCRSKMENFRRTFNLGSPGSNLDHQNPASTAGGGGTRPRLYPSLSQVEESRNYNLYNRSTSNEEADSANKNPSEMKQKILSVWHGIKYGKTAFSWNSEALMSSSVLQEDSKAKMKADSCGLGKYSAVWLLGRMYHSKGGPSRSFDVRKYTLKIMDNQSQTCFSLGRR